MIILTVKRNLTWSVPRKKNRWRWTDAEQALQLLYSIDPGASVKSTKVPREPILITEKWRRKKFFRASRGLIATTHLYAAALCTLPPLLLTSSAASARGSSSNGWVWNMLWKSRPAKRRPRNTISIPTFQILKDPQLAKHTTTIRLQLKLNLQNNLYCTTNSAKFCC